MPVTSAEKSIKESRDVVSHVRKRMFVVICMVLRTLFVEIIPNLISLTKSERLETSIKDSRDVAFHVRRNEHQRK